MGSLHPSAAPRHVVFPGVSCHMHVGLADGRGRSCCLLGCFAASPDRKNGCKVLSQLARMQQLAAAWSSRMYVQDVPLSSLVEGPLTPIELMPSSEQVCCVLQCHAYLWRNSFLKTHSGGFASRTGIM
jgi:hypothetical protein